MANQFRGYDSDDIRVARKQYLRETGRKKLSPTVNGVPVYDLGDNKEFRDIYGVYNPKVRTYNEDETVDSYETAEKYTVKQDGKILDDEYEFGGEGIGPDSRQPAPLTVKPTTSSNFERPYTVAAGWQKYPFQGRITSKQELGTLSVMFRDGTLWNYYSVPRSTWETFRGLFSKGQYINRNSQNPVLNTFAHGPAELSGASDASRRYIQRTAREAQVRYRARKALPGGKMPNRVTKQGTASKNKPARKPRKR